MANLLLNASQWHEINYDSGVSPPPEWDGTSYTFIGNIGAGKFYTGADLQATAAAGDTVAFTATNHSAADTLLEVIKNGATTLFTQNLTSGQSVSWESAALADGDLIDIWVDQGQFVYTQDMVITPTVQPVAHDIEVSIPMNSPAITITPTITGG